MDPISIIATVLAAAFPKEIRAFLCRFFNRKPAIEAPVPVTGKVEDNSTEGVNSEAPFCLPFNSRNPNLVDYDGYVNAVADALTGEGKTYIGQETQASAACHQGAEAAISGHGGIGKSSMAAEYAFRNRTRYPGGVYWIGMEQGLVLGLVGLAAHTKFCLNCGMEKDPETIASMALKHMEARQGLKLVIADNLEQGAELARLKELDHTHLLVTTRLGPSQIDLKPVLMDLPDEEQAVEILLGYSANRNQTGDRKPNEADKEAAADIAQRVGYLPLALEILGRLANSYPSLTELSKRLDSVLDKEGALHAKTGKVKSISAVLNLANEKYSKAKKEQKKAKQALTYISYLDPDGISAELLALVMGMEGSEAADILAALAARSVLRPAGKTGAYRVHRLVQEASREQKGKEKVGNKVVKALDRAIDEPMKKGRYVKCLWLVPTLMHILRLVSTDTPLDQFPHDGSMGNFSECLWFCGLHQNTTEAATFNLDRTKRIRGEDSPEYATYLNNLALVLRSQGKYTEAEELYRQAIKIDEKTIGKEHSDYAIHLNNLALVLESQGKYTEAEGLYRQAIEIGEKTIGKEHPSYAIRLNNLAGVLESQGKYTEAEVLYRQAIKIDEKTIGKEHPEYAKHLNNLANVLDSQGKYTEAEELCRQAIDIDLKTLGPDHPQTKNHQRNLDILLSDMAKK